MKKLKIIFLCCLISILFIPNIKAVNTDYYFEIKNSETLQTIVNNNQDKINKIKEYVESNCIGQYCISNSNNDYVLSIQMSNIDSTFAIRLIDYTSYTSNNSLSGMNSYYASNQYGTSASLAFPQTRYQQQFQFVNGELQAVNNASLSSGSFGWTNITTCNPTSENCSLDNGSWYFDTSYMNNERYFKINTNSCSGISGTCLFVPVKLNDTYYYSGDYVPISSFLNSFVLQTNPYKCTIEPGAFRTGSLSNISDFEYRITADNLSSEDYGIEGSFAFKNSSFTFSDNNFNWSDYWEIEVIKGPDSIGEYNVNGVLSWDDTTKVLTVNYGVYTTGSDPAKIDCIIKLIPKSQYSKDYFGGVLNFYSCNPTNPNIFLNDSYGYTDNITGLTNSYDSSLMNFMNDSSNPDLQIFNNMKSLLPPGPVDSILTIPIQMLYAINNFLGGNCQPFNINLPFINRNIELKCIRSFYSDIGATTFVEGVGSIASVIILIQYFVGLYNWIDSNIQITHNKLKSWGAGEV